MIAAAGADSGRGGIWIFPQQADRRGALPVRLSGTEVEGRFGAGAEVAGEYLLVGAPLVPRRRAAR